MEKNKQLKNIKDIEAFIKRLSLNKKLREQEKYEILLEKLPKKENINKYYSEKNILKYLEDIVENYIEEKYKKEEKNKNFLFFELYKSYMVDKYYEENYINKKEDILFLNRHVDNFIFNYYQLVKDLYKNHQILESEGVKKLLEKIDKKRLLFLKLALVKTKTKSPRQLLLFSDKIIKKVNKYIKEKGVRKEIEKEGERIKKEVKKM